MNDAYRNLLVQNLLLTWRYSIGNPYEQFSFPEGVDVAEVMGELGYADVARSILRTSLTRKDEPYPNWKMGERLVGSALHYRLTRDRAYLEGATPTLRRYVDELGRQIGASRTGCSAASATRRTSRTRCSGCTRRRPSGRGCGRWAASGRRPATPRSRGAARRSPSGSRPACGARSPPRSGGSPTARCSSRRGCSTASRPTAR